MKKQILLIPLIGIGMTLTGCSTVSETMRALECNRQAVDMSTQVICENAQAIDEANQKIDENRRQLERINQALQNLGG